MKCENRYVVLAFVVVGVFMWVRSTTFLMLHPHTSTGGHIPGKGFHMDHLFPSQDPGGHQAAGSDAPALQTTTSPKRRRGFLERLERKLKKLRVKFTGEAVESFDDGGVAEESPQQMTTEHRNDHRAKLNEIQEKLLAVKARFGEVHKKLKGLDAPPSAAIANLENPDSEVSSKLAEIQNRVEALRQGITDIRKQVKLPTQEPPSLSNAKASTAAVTSTPIATSGAQVTGTIQNPNKVVQTGTTPPARSSFKYPPESFWILIICKDRADYLKQTLRSLWTVEGIDKKKVVLSQDGNAENVQQVAREFDIQRIQPVGPRPGKEAAEFIATHYKGAFSYMFDNILPGDVPHFIVIEEDMKFSPDFLYYFSQLAPVMESDPTIWSVSSWNDNGKRDLVRDIGEVYRTEWFVGLGWLVSRELYKGELESKWPPTHWDHWMREPRQRQGRETLYPEVNRVYHIGEKGAHSDKSLFDKYFRDIRLCDVRYVQLDVDRLSLAHYDEYMNNLISASTKASFVTLDNVVAETQQDDSIVIIYPMPVASDRTKWTPIAQRFGLWHEPERGTHSGLMRFWYKQRHIVLVGSYSKFAKDHQDKSVGSAVGQVGATTAVGQTVTDGDVVVKTVDTDSGYTLVAAVAGASCNVACESLKKKCIASNVGLVNNCETLKKVFSCESSCHASGGMEQPAYVPMSSSANFGPGKCLYNTETSSYPPNCEGSHFATQRLCPCSA